LSQKFGCPIGPALIRAPESLCTTTTCSPHSRGSRGRRTRPRCPRASFYARSCKRTSENTHKAKFVERRLGEVGVLSLRHGAPVTHLSGGFAGGDRCGPPAPSPRAFGGVRGLVLALRVALAAVRSLQPVLHGRGLGHGTRAKERVLTIVRVVVVGSRATLLVVNEKSPWLNPMKPKWIHGKRKVVEPPRSAGNRGARRVVTKSWH
jgi:hypothetical protein